MTLKHNGISIEIEGDVESVEIVDGVIKIKPKQSTCGFFPYTPYTQPVTVPAQPYSPWGSPWTDPNVTWTLTSGTISNGDNPLLKNLRSYHTSGFAQIN